MMQERALARGADARHLVEHRARDVGGPSRTVRSDGKPVGLVAQALEEIEDGIARFQREGRLAGQEEALAPS
jgi:DNA-directed RNA polymerase subunit K/omega